MKKPKKKVKKAAGSRPKRPARRALRRRKPVRAKPELSLDERDQMEAQTEELLAAQVELEDSRNRYAELFDHAPVGYLTLSANGEIVDVNIKTAELLGRPRDVLQGAYISMFAATREDLLKVLGHLRLCRKGGGEVRTILMLKAPPGKEPVPVEMLSFSPEHGGKLFHTALIDLTEQASHEASLRKARDAAERSAEAKDDFLAALSHELRTPLNPVLLIASQNAENLGLPEAIRQDFEMIVKNITLEARLIDDLLDLTQVTQGKMILEHRDLDIHAVLRDALGNVNADLEQKSIVVTLDFGPCEHAVVGDAIRLQQVFWNIIRNAAKFTPRNGSLRILSRSDPDRGTVRFDFTDSGIGLQPAEIPNIFDAFAQGRHSKERSHRFGGLGLGLSISKRVVGLHSGSITAASAGPMEGATFSVELPLSDTSLPLGMPANEVPPQLPEDGIKRKPKLLLVEDHQPTRTALSDLLGRRGFEVIPAATVAEARKAAAAEKVDIVVSDVGLPDGDGHALMSELNGGYGLRGVALTGYGTEIDIVQSHAAGFAAHLTKPIQIKSLIAALKPLISSDFRADG